MTPLILGIDFHRDELERVARDLRTERALAAPKTGPVDRARFALGGALVQLGTVVSAGSGSVRANQPTQ